MMEEVTLGRFGDVRLDKRGRNSWRAWLRAVRAAIPADPLCDPAIRTRVILAPRAANDVAVAAAAWGHVYRADCVDTASLTSFILQHYGMGPENFCVPGQVF